MILTSIRWWVTLKITPHVVDKLSPGQAIKVAESVLSIFPGDQRATVVKLVGLYGLNMLDDALDYGKKASAMFPQNLAIYGILGDILVHKGDNDAALISFNNVLAVNPNITTALLRKGNLLGEMGHTDMALECYDRVIRYEKDAMEDVFFAYLAKGSLLINAHRFDDVKEFCGELFESYPDLPSILSMVGAFYCQIGQPSDGISYYKKALEYSQNNPAMMQRIKTIIDDVEKGNEANVSTLQKE